MSLNIAPIPGAAKYFAWSNPEKSYSVYMQSTDGYLSEVETRRTLVLAERAADRWQKKENKAVAKAMKG